MSSTILSDAHWRKFALLEKFCKGLTAPLANSFGLFIKVLALVTCIIHSPPWLNTGTSYAYLKQVSKSNGQQKPLVKDSFLVLPICNLAIHCFMVQKNLTVIGLRTVLIYTCKKRNVVTAKFNAIIWLSADKASFQEQRFSLVVKSTSGLEIKK